MATLTATAVLPVSILIWEQDKEKREPKTFQRVATVGYPTETPGLVVTPRYLNTEEREQLSHNRLDGHRYLRRAFHPEHCQIIHRESGALLATFRDRQAALDAAEELGILGIDWQLAQATIALKHPPICQARVRLQQIFHKYGAL